MTVNRSDFQKQLMSGVTATDKIIVLDDGGTDEPGVVTAANLAGSAPFTSTLVTSSTLTTDGDVLTRAAGAPARIARADLAQDSAFSSRYASSTSFPAGAWTAWTPTLSPDTGTITTSTVLGAEYQQYGKLVVCAFSIRIDNKGTAGGSLVLSLPVTAESSSGLGNGGWCGGYRETANAGAIGFVGRSGSSSAFLLEIDGTTPFNFNGDIFRGTFTYEAA